jgi:O-antigen ligase
MGLVILFSVFICYAFIVRGKRITGLVLCGLGATTLLLFLTNSRSSLLTATFVTVPVMLITQKRLGSFRKRLIAACLVVFLITPLLAFIWFSHAEKGRKSPANVITRYHAWQTSLDMATREPWYRFYIGYGNIKGVNIKVADHFGLDFSIGHSHNMFFQTLIEMGMLGLMTLIFIFGLALHGVYREWKVNKQASGDLSPVFITTIITILVVGQMDHILKNLPGQLVWIIVGLALAYGKLGYQESALRKSVQERHSVNSPTV